MGDGGAARGQQPAVGIGQPDAVRADEPVVQQPLGVEHLHGRLAGGLDAFVGFALGFGNVRLDDQVVGLGEIAADGAHFGGGGVERVDADGQFDAGGIGLGEGEVLLEIAAEAGQRLRARGNDVGMAEIGADAAFVEGAEALGGLPIHVEGGGDAGADHFEAAEEGAPIDVVRSEPALHGPDDVVEPLVQGQAVAEPAHQNHGGMAMHVGEGRQEGQARAVQRLGRPGEAGGLDFRLDFRKKALLDENIPDFGAQTNVLDEQIHEKASRRSKMHVAADQRMDS